MNKIHKFKQTEIGLIPEDWEVIEIREVADVCSSKRVYMKDYVKCGIPFFRSKEIIQKSNNQNISTELFISDDLYYNLKNKFGAPEKDDILITSVGTIGVSYRVKENEKFYFKDGNLTWLRNYKEYIFPLYFEYFIKSNIFIQQLLASSIGSTQQAITIIALKKIKISLPNYSEQVSIAKILSDLDSKIELLQKQNETLEKIGQALFKHWFVDFEFPNENGEPYKSSGGEMVESELGEIPEGWSVGNYGELLEFERGIEPGSRNYLDKKEDNTILFYRVGDLLFEDSTIYVKKDIIKNKIANKNNILVSFDGTVGRVKIGIEGSYSTGIRKVYSKDNLFTNGFIYFLMKSDFIQNKITKFAKGTTILHAGEAIKHFITVIPDNKIRTNFNIIAESTFEKLLININEIKNLQKTRDLLLPKLMTGKIRVPLEVEE